MGRSVRVGVIGTGIGARVVAPAYRAAGCEVVDVVSARDPVAVAALCRRPLDLVSVHSPPFLHATHVGWALEAGRAVLCDKPFGTSAAEAAAMTADAAAAGALNFVNFEFRRQPARQRLHELVHAGEIGRPEHLHYCAFDTGSRSPLRRYGWLFDRSRGGGWVGAFGSHAIDLARWLLGEVEEVVGRTWVTVHERPDADGDWHRCDAEDAFSCWLRLASGATATIDSSFTAVAAVPPRITVTGSEGTVENIGDVRVTLRRRDGSREQSDFELGPDFHDVAMTRWVRDVVDAVREGEQIVPSFGDGLRCARVMDELRAAPAASVVHA
jgi:predicted dehydrogenase